MSSQTKLASSNTMLRWSVVLAFALIAFFISYRFAIAANGTARAAAGVPGSASSVAAAGGGCGMSSGAGASGAGGGCCGGGAPAGPATTKKADVTGDVQKITVDLSKGYYDPSVIELKAGVPAQITFGQGGGCLAQVQSQDLGFYEDLTGGPKTISLDALQPGTYSFTCGMAMVSGSIVVK